MKPKLIIGNKNYSSWSLRPWLLMREAGIDFDEHRIVLDVESTAAEIASFKAGKTVPILHMQLKNYAGTLRIPTSTLSANSSAQADLLKVARG